MRRYLNSARDATQSDMSAHGVTSRTSNLVARVLSLSPSRKDTVGGWARDCTQKTSTRSGYTRSIIFFFFSQESDRDFQAGAKAREGREFVAVS